MYTAPQKRKLHQQAFWNVLIATGSIMWAAYVLHGEFGKGWNEVKPWWFPVTTHGHWTGSGTIVYIASNTSSTVATCQSADNGVRVIQERV